MILSAAQAAHVHQHGDKQNNQAHAGKGLPRIYHPSVNQSGERKNKEPHNRDQESVIGALQVIRKQENQRQRDSRKRDQEDYKEAGHLLVGLDLSQAVPSRGNLTEVPPKFGSTADFRSGRRMSLEHSR